MSILATVALVFPAAVLGLLIAALLTTWRLRLGVVKDGHWRFSAVLRFLDGRGPPIPISGGSRKLQKKGVRKPRTRPGGTAWPAGPEVVGDAVDLLRCIHLRSAKVSAQFGCHDPADTGHLYGLLTPVIYGAGGAAAVDLDVAPVFDRECLEGMASIDVSVRPIALVPPAARLAWHLSRGNG